MVTVDTRPVLMICSLFVCVLGMAMGIPALVDFLAGEAEWRVFAISSAITLFCGSGVYFANRIPLKALRVREALALTVLAWLSLVLFASVPLAISPLTPTFTDAFFESMSGLSTTGATILSGLDDAPPGILLWRSILNCLGGIGIVVMAVSALPFFRVGGMQIFQMESSENVDKALPRMDQMARGIVGTYFLLILLCAVALYLAGMNLFDSINHAMTSVSTGGFSPHDKSIGFYDNPLFEAILIVFMTAGALPLSYYLRFVGARRVRGHDPQVRAFLKFLALMVAVMSLWLWQNSDYSLLSALRHAAFNTVSILTDCGLASMDYSQWGLFAVSAFLFFPFVGGCTGSTAGAIKIFRWQILIRYLKTFMVHIFQPHRVIAVQYGKKRHSTDMVLSVALFIAMYFVCFCVLTLLVSLTRVDFLTAASGVIAAMANSGPGLGDIIGPAGNYSTLPQTAKWLLSFAMLLGRLEIFTLLVFFLPAYWKD